MGLEPMQLQYHKTARATAPQQLNIDRSWIYTGNDFFSEFWTTKSNFKEFINNTDHLQSMQKNKRN